MSVELITKETLREKNLVAFNKGLLGTKNPVNISNSVLGSDYSTIDQEEQWRRTEKAEFYGNVENINFTGNHGSAFDIPYGKWGTVRDNFKKGVFGQSNTLLPDWENFWDAVKIELSKSLVLEPYIGNLIYNENVNPGYTQSVDLRQIFDPAAVFKENNGEGQAIRQGEFRGGETESIIMKIYAAGFSWTLMMELFDNRLDMSKINNAIARGYNSLRNDIAIGPILNYSYSGIQQTPAATTSGAKRQELLYNTIQDGIDDLKVRIDPVTLKKIPVRNAIILTNEFDADNIVTVLKGLPSVKDNELFPAITNISKVIGYDGETIQLNGENVVYDGVADKIAYLLIPKNRYMHIPVKRTLTAEVDPMPNITKLLRKQHAWWFVQSIFFKGVEYFVQEITLPAW
jgi:hypothetical protein